MANRAHNILNEVESEYGIKFDGNFWPDVLCHDTHCIDENCGCWRRFRNAVKEEAKKLAAIKTADAVLEFTPRGKSLAYDGSVTLCDCGDEIRDGFKRCAPCELVYSPYHGRGAERVEGI